MQQGALDDIGVCPVGPLRLPFPAITPFAAAYPGAVIGVSLASGKEVWRGPDPAQNAAVAFNARLAYILAKSTRCHHRP